MKKTIAVVVALSAFAIAKSAVDMSVSSYQEVTKKDKSGKVVKVWTKSTKVVPGTIIKYVDTITNDSNETIVDAKITNPIDKNLLFIDNSVKSKAKFSVKYSVDKGVTYSEPSKLYIKDKNGKKQLATAKDYNAIFIKVDRVPAHSKVDVEYRVKIK